MREPHPRPRQKQGAENAPVRTQKPTLATWGDKWCGDGHLDTAAPAGGERGSAAKKGRRGRAGRGCHLTQGPTPTHGPAAGRTSRGSQVWAGPAGSAEWMVAQGTDVGKVTATQTGDFILSKKGRGRG